MWSGAQVAVVERQLMLTSWLLLHMLSVSQCWCSGTAAAGADVLLVIHRPWGLKAGAA